VGGIAEPPEGCIISKERVSPLDSLTLWRAIASVEGVIYDVGERCEEAHERRLCGSMKPRIVGSITLKRDKVWRASVGARV
jgi:hypothetical protein